MRKNIMTYSLSVEELVLALGLINYPGLGRELLGIDSLTEEQIDSRLISASHSLLAHGLCEVSQTDTPVLKKEFEKALFPLARFDYLLQLEIARGADRYVANIHVHNGKGFTVHSSHSGLVHTLENGQKVELVSYLNQLIEQFGPIEGTAAQSRSKITSELMGQMLTQEKNQSEIEAVLTAHGWSKKDAGKLADDSISCSLLVRLLRVESTDDISVNQPKSLMLLQGKARSWLFEFPVAAQSTEGSSRLVDRKSFLEALASFVG